MYSKSTEYAIRAIIFIALKGKPGKPLGAVDIAHKLDFPEAFLSKVLQNLAKKNLVISVKGPGGGFYVDKEILKYTILNIVEILEDMDFLCKCGLGLHTCNHENPCPIHDEYELVKVKMRNALSYKSINQIKDEIAEGTYSMQFELN
ncbi:MAG TPA: Rrf2 family transcriptional regulator [Bacteroidales bacterium]|jgi:Rrf2 family protein|nr:Rrf2 family transcriptional regulator [Bacteroidales bacterium]|tara:strand:- start:74 stop:514 length:441 start_codon:yes stop_codon:yes gene_type:complete